MRQRGSVRFSPYFKVQRWVPRSVSWLDVQRAFPTLEAAIAAAPRLAGDARWRVMEISPEGRRPAHSADS